MTMPSSTCPALMLQGTGSDVGKSLLVAGLCRAFARRGLKVRPFKPQNMSNNAAVTADGGEIGRAQALQARAAGVAPSRHMNPVLLKPTSEVGAQVVVQGQVLTTASAADYHALKPNLMPKVLESFVNISAEADLVLIEGAGSAAEVNLRDADIANMGFAEAAHVPVVLVGDIERGGVIASIIGTQVVLNPGERERLVGYVINKFRGDPKLFEGGIAAIASHTGLRCFGVVPFFPLARDLPKEDAMALDRAAQENKPSTAERIRIAVPRLSRIANFDDLDPLASEEDVELSMVAPGDTIPADADVVILPGSKATRADMSFLRLQGWDVDIAAHVRRGGMVVGLCGGYQMLGRKVADPGGVEGPAGETPGLGLLDVETVMTGDKTLELVDGTDMVTGEAVTGYEMHVGLTAGQGRHRPWIELADGRFDGAMSEDGLVMGCYLHGVFAADAFRHAFLSRIRQGRVSGLAHELRIEAALDGLAAHLERNLDLDALLAVAARRDSRD